MEKSESHEILQLLLSRQLEWQLVRLSGAGAFLVRRGEVGVAVLLVVRRVNYSEQLQIGRWGGGRNWSSDEKMVVDKNL